MGATNSVPSLRTKSQRVSAEVVWWVWVRLMGLRGWFGHQLFYLFDLFHFFTSEKGVNRGCSMGVQWVFNGCRRAVVLTEATVYLFNTLNVFRWNLFNTLNVFRQNLFNALNVFRQNLFNALNVFPIWHRVLQMCLYFLRYTRLLRLSACLSTTDNIGRTN